MTRRCNQRLTSELGQILRILAILTVVLTLTVGPALAQNNSSAPTQQDLKNKINQVGQFLSIVIVAVAVPNGAFGLFQWMTAGTDTEQSDKGRKRIRNSFIGAGGAAIVMMAVQVLANMV
ncbi:hypothetical protein Hrd1104_11450 [Halorhabdus sp. CBA1104]|uniref:hypothetical protein n=1 Tax=unclassified Halorhabdus TaxID=2621901 RepID=UPI0012B4EC8D|nr:MULTISPECIES: hypothetical protein [unclassified Halorhabdus]QGN07855.1 hypothetical protein Hrd1104_11450 [Halorhabdus sp. CBA1104]